MVEIRALRSVDEVLNIMGVFILARETSFPYTMRRVTILLKKPWFIVDLAHTLNSVDVKRQKVLDVVLLGHCIALYLHLTRVRLRNLLFDNPAVIFYFCFSLWTAARFRRYWRTLTIVFFIIIELQFVCLPEPANPTSNVKPHALEKSLFDILWPISCSLLSKYSALSL